MSKIIPLAFAVAAALTLADSASAQSSQVEAVQIIQAPTETLRVNVAGKDQATARREISAAAATVCQAAYGKRDFDREDSERFAFQSCRDWAAWDGMRQYARIVSPDQMAASAVVILASR